MFEIVDFTTASDWEKFTADIEEAIHGWRLTGIRSSVKLKADDIANAEWIEKSVTIKFIGSLNIS